MNITTASLTNDREATTAASSHLSLLRVGGPRRRCRRRRATELVAAVALVPATFRWKQAASAPTPAEPIPVFGFWFATLLWTAVGILMAVAMTRWAKRPAHTFTVTVVILTAVSLCRRHWPGPLATDHDGRHDGTKPHPRR